MTMLHLSYTKKCGKYIKHHVGGAQFESTICRILIIQTARPSGMKRKLKLNKKKYCTILPPSLSCDAQMHQIFKFKCKIFKLVQRFRRKAQKVPHAPISQDCQFREFPPPPPFAS